MKQTLRKLFAFILNIFESGDGAFVYKKSHRYILLFIGFMFTGMATAVVYVAKDVDLSYLFSALIFATIGLTSFLVGLLGNERAVAKIWGSR
jgi:drug/metabolite transporter (DMT)-like permease